MKQTITLGWDIEVSLLSRLLPLVTDTFYPYSESTPSSDINAVVVCSASDFVKKSGFEAEMRKIVVR